MSSSADVRAPRRRIAGERGRTRPAEAPVGRTTTPEASGPGLATRLREAAGRRTARTTDRASAPVAASPAASTSRRRWVAPLVALAAALAVLGALLAIGLRDPGAQARSDRAAASQARTSLEQVLSYNYKTIDASSASAAGLLTGSFKGEFTKAMETSIKPLAVKNQTVVQAKVSDLGVMSSSPTHVRVLAFVNQAKVGADQKQPVVDQNRVIVTMTRVGERWLVSKVDAF